MSPLLAALRPVHWIKNAWLAAPLVFAGQLVHPASLARTVAITVAFCALSSAVYLMNDLHDAELDRGHPDKRSRPLAAGTLSRGRALTASIVLAAAGLGLAAAVAARSPVPTARLSLGLGAGQWGLAYLLHNGLYTWWLKAVPVLDVLAIAVGFVLRLMAGSAALGLVPSQWLLVCGFSLALLLALGKRRLEFTGPGGGATSRPALAHYALPSLDRLIVLAAAACAVTYLAYTLSPVTVAKVGSRGLLLSLPPVLLALLRFTRLLRHPPRRDLVTLLLADRWMLGSALAWLVIALLVVGVHP